MTQLLTQQVCSQQYASMYHQNLISGQPEKNLSIKREPMLSSFLCEINHFDPSTRQDLSTSKVALLLQLCNCPSHGNTVLKRIHCELILK